MPPKKKAPAASKTKKPARPSASSAAAKKKTTSKSNSPPATRVSRGSTKTSPSSRASTSAKKARAAPPKAKPKPATTRTTKAAATTRSAPKAKVVTPAAAAAKSKSKKKAPPKAAAKNRKRARSPSSSAESPARSDVPSLSATVKQQTSDLFGGPTRTSRGDSPGSQSSSSQSSGWDEVPSSLFSQAILTHSSLASSSATAAPASRTGGPGRGAAPSAEAAKHDGHQEDNEEEPVGNEPRTPTRSTTHTTGDNEGSPESLTADSEGRRSTTAFRNSLFRQQQEQEQHRRFSGDGDATTAPPGGSTARPRAQDEPPHEPIAVVKELFQRPARGISCDTPAKEDVVVVVDGGDGGGGTARKDTSARHLARASQDPDDDVEEVLIPSEDSDNDDVDTDTERSRTRHSFNIPPPPADTATPPPSSLTLPTHQLPPNDDDDDRGHADRTATISPPRRARLSLAGAITPRSSGGELAMVHDVDTNEEALAIVHCSNSNNNSTSAHPSQAQHAHADRGAGTESSLAARHNHSSTSTALSPYALPRDPTVLLENAHRTATAGMPPLPLSPSPQAPPRLSQGHLRLGSVSRPRSPATAAPPQPPQSSANTTAFMTPPRLPSLPRGGGVRDGAATGTRHADSRRTSPRGTDAGPQSLFPREPPIWRSPQPSRHGPTFGATNALPSPANSTVHSHLPSPFTLSHAQTSTATAVAGLDGRRETPSRPSAQLVTRAAAVRPTAAPATMWICIDEDDDDDVEVPTSPTSPTLKHVLIAPRPSEASKTTSAAATAAATASPQMPGYPMAPVKREVSHSASGDEEQRQFLQQEQEKWVSEREEEARQRAETSHKTSTAAPLVPVPTTSPSTALKDGLAITAAAPSTELAKQADAVETTRPPAIRPLREPIGDVLSPTFRPRRGAIPLHRAPTQRLSPLPSGCYIRMDDDDDEDDEDEDDENEEDKAHTSAVQRPTQRDGSTSSEDIPIASIPSSPLKDGVVAPSPSGSTQRRAASSLSIHAGPLSSFTVKDDDNDDDKNAENEEEDDATHKNRRHASDKNNSSNNKIKAQVKLNEEVEVTTPLRSVKQLLFPARHAHGTDDTDGSGAASDALLFRTAAAAASSSGTAAEAATDASKKNKKKSTKKGRGSKGEDGDAIQAEGWGRPVDVLQREFFASKLTKKCFMEAARKAISDEHFLGPGEFWSAFSSAEFVGEGSFGLVWRCRSVEGDLVAVKSCPVSLATRANIDDSFSTVREVATMRFLSEMQVPYVLPMHSAFFVSDAESLPPAAMEALTWRRAQRKKAEAAALERQVQLLSRGKKPPAARRGKRATTTTTTGAETDGVDEPPLSLEEETARQLVHLRESESEEEAAERARHEAVRLPRFLSITEEDVLEGEATIFLVLELCDGDLEGIRRTDGLTKGVAFCVSSALAAMHELGLLHLDLKPSNILYAYEHGPSQQPQLQPPPGALTSALASHVHPGASVKFYLSDFGNCRVVGPNPYDIVDDAFGTFEYMDLAALKDKICSRATDNFSLGATLYELLFGCRVYPRCENPKCLGDEDHTRHCFVDAATRPIVLPIADANGAVVAAESGLTADQLAAHAGLKGKDHKTKGKQNGGRSRQHAKNDKEKESVGTDRSPFSVASASNTKVALTVLQKLTAALLQQDPHERMTAEQCRACLIQAYNITQEEEEEGNGRGDADERERS